MSFADMEVTDSDLAELVGITARRIRQLATEGKLKRQGRNKYPLGDSIRVLLAEQAENTDGSELQKERLLKLRAERQLAELELAKHLGEVALISEFQQAQTARAAIIQTNVMRVATRGVLRLLGETCETRWKSVMREELSNALRSAAEADLDLPTDDEESHAQD